MGGTCFTAEGSSAPSETKALAIELVVVTFVPLVKALRSSSAALDSGKFSNLVRLKKGQGHRQISLNYN